MRAIDKYITDHIEELNSKEGLRALLRNDKLDFRKAVREVQYEEKLKKLQEELLKLQKWVVANDKKVVIVFEGRDAAGKGGAIRRLSEHLNPREYRVVALPKPDEVEQGQWYFQRYINAFPNKGEMVFFDRSWYNRAVVEPVNGFCTPEEYDIFMEQVLDVERMMLQSKIHLVKIYFSIDRREQEKRFKEIQNSPLKKWKFSPVDQKAIELWDKYTEYKEKMFEITGKHVPWKIIKANRKSTARLQALKYILDSIPYDKNIELMP